MISSGTPDTGAHIPGRKNVALATIDVDATTLDDLFASDIKAADRALLKLDLQGHELLALRGLRAFSR